MYGRRPLVATIIAVLLVTQAAAAQGPAGGEAPRFAGTVFLFEGIEYTVTEQRGGTTETSTISWQCEASISVSGGRAVASVSHSSKFDYVHEDPDAAFPYRQTIREQRGEARLRRTATADDLDIRIQTETDGNDAYFVAVDIPPIPVEKTVTHVRRDRGGKEDRTVDEYDAKAKCDFVTSLRGEATPNGGPRGRARQVIMDDIDHDGEPEVIGRRWSRWQLFETDPSARRPDRCETEGSNAAGEQNAPCGWHGRIVVVRATPRQELGDVARGLVVEADCATEIQFGARGVVIHRERESGYLREWSGQETTVTTVSGLDSTMPLGVDHPWMPDVSWRAGEEGGEKWFLRFTDPLLNVERRVGSGDQETPWPTIAAHSCLEGDEIVFDGPNVHDRRASELIGESRRRQVHEKGWRVTLIVCWELYSDERRQATLTAEDCRARI